MNIAADKVVSIEYTLKNDAGDVLDTSEGQEPLTYLHGGGNIIPGLERALDGKSAGDKLQVSIAPEDAYGPRRSQLVQSVPRSAFDGEDEIEPGMRFQAHGPEGLVVVTVTEVQGDTVTLDANHPLAGETLHFDVEVTQVRDATQEEIAHGHVHGPGGHHHG